MSAFSAVEPDEAEIALLRVEVFPVHGPVIFVHVHRITRKKMIAIAVIQMSVGVDYNKRKGCH
ncbi:hypothetical protein HNP82_002723 [Catenibacillus scindens]|uniref:Uncharacterized protein n=1 Tax=Catenibacillus scindens TaxID=673271 RepID=A0A7W8HBX9_9FIRM|nr:hypothetical protein [Catenibacillus scindens]MBB5265577.1 hypothetical protein [Catenibacillus scindens]